MLLSIQLTVKLFWLFVLGRVASQSFQACPRLDLLHPCTCSRESTRFLNHTPNTRFTNIDCFGLQPLQLNTVFDRLSSEYPKEQLKFDRLVIGNSNIKSIEFNSTGAATFKLIYVAMNQEATEQLDKIHEEAFIGTEQTTSQFWFKTSEKHRNFQPNQDSPYNFLNLINRLVNIWFLRISAPIDLHLPKESFKSERRLTDIRIQTFEGRLTIDGGAFAGRRLNALSISTSRFDRVPAGFIDVPPGDGIREGRPFRLRLFNCSLTDFSFDNRAFVDCCRRRPMHLELNKNRISKLDEEVFRPFFDSNPDNMVNIGETDIDGQTPENAWWSKNDDYKSRVLTFTDRKDLQFFLRGFPVEKLGRVNKWIHPHESLELPKNKQYDKHSDDGLFDDGLLDDLPIGLDD